MKVGEVARLLGVSTSWVYRQIRSGALPAQREKWLYEVAESDARALRGRDRPLKDRVDELAQQLDSLPGHYVTKNEFADLHHRIGLQFRLMMQALGLDRPLTRHAFAGWLGKHHVSSATAREWIERWIREGALQVDADGKINVEHKAAALRLGIEQQKANPPQHPENRLQRCQDSQEPFCVCHEILTP